MTILLHAAGLMVAVLAIRIVQAAYEDFLHRRYGAHLRHEREDFDRLWGAG
jgi:hypothetical protein